MPASPDRAPPGAARGPLLALACSLLAIAAWSGSVLRGGFAFDDREALSGNPVVEGGAPWSAAFRRDYWDHLAPAGHYRPLASLSLRLDHALHGPAHAAGWHATNVLLHAATVAALALVLLGSAPLRGPGARLEPLPWLGVALFAVHPALADSVAWISGRSSMLSACVGLGGAAALLLTCHAPRPPTSPRLLLAAGACFLGLLGALLGKEDGVVFGLLYLALAAGVSRRALASAGAGCAAALVAYLALRAAALGSPWPSAPHAPLAGEPLPARLLVAGRALLEALRLAVLPLGYPPSYDRAAFLRPPAEGHDSAWYALAGLGWLPWLALLVGGLLAARRRPRSAVAWGAVLAALSLLPVLQLVPAGTLLAPRFLYLPLLFLTPCFHAAWRSLPPALGRWLGPALLLLGVAGAWQRAGVYADRESFHREVLRHRPDDAPAWNELGLAREERGDLAGARAAFERSAALDAGYGRPWSNLGRLALARDETERAEACLREAVSRGSANPVAHVNLGAVLLRLGRHEEARAAYARATALAPGSVPAWRGLARALRGLERPDDARAALQRALALDPSDRASAALLRDLQPP